MAGVFINIDPVGTLRRIQDDVRPDPVAAAAYIQMAGAAGIACGEDCPGEAVGTDTLVAPPWPDELPEILYVDHYGNAVTGVRAEALDRDAVVEVAGRRCAFRRTFAEAAAGEAFWYRNANGLVEVALNQASAARQLGLAVGTQIQVSG